MAASWETVAQQKQESLLASIPSEWRLPDNLLGASNVDSDSNLLHLPRESGLLSTAEIEITENHSAVDLVRKMKGKALSSVEVTTAFCKRAAIAHQLVNCCSEMFFDTAIKRARECDEYLYSHGQPMGPLHGLPISVKDLFQVPGVQSACGFIAYASEPPCTETKGLTSVLLSLGAVLYVKTNMSQMGSALDSHNNLVGRTLNPLRTSLTPGGSSGGESALLALRGSVLGVGTDALGSLRVPAHCCGLHALKPSPNRVIYGGRQLGTPGVPRLPLHVGPLAHNVEDIRLFMQAIIESKPWELDAELISSPWRGDQRVTKKLRIGVLKEDRTRLLHPPMLRTMTIATKRLEQAGHEVVNLTTRTNFPSLLEARLVLRYALMDPYGPALFDTKSAGEPLVPSVLNCMPPTDVRQRLKPSLEALIEANVQRAELADRVREVFVSNKLDALMMPLHDTVAQPVDTWNSGTYLALWNLLPHPAMVLPVGQAESAADAEYHRDRLQAGYFPDDAQTKLPYNPEQVEGMPCSVQLVGNPLRDEELIEIAAKLRGVLPPHS